MKPWLSEIDRYAREGVPNIIVACKTDLVSERVVDCGTAVEFCDSLEIEHMETSAKNSHGVEDLFVRAARISAFVPLSLACTGEEEACMAMKCTSVQERRYVSALDLSNNSLSRIPQEVFLFEHLVSIDVSNNSLTGLPVRLLRLPRVFITFANNPLVSSMHNVTKFSPEMLRQYFAAQFCGRSIVCAAMIWRLRESIWRLLGHDVMKIIAGMLWSTRGDVRCWVNEAAIASMEEQEKRELCAASNQRTSACSIQ